ncbi:MULTISPECIES: NADH-quinone oxidoreductase subunit A [unclassified Schaalia]|uniref:NADH-quinone oxidoreductase subunit A n=1 Tax=unclassified Schaalia TaxID=2691889 RepID=UPI001E480DB2|nr:MULTISPECIES: NADH-quinone oxidoreductase subunit A [unclassified Schaalia]MCD4549113.1 NADH-quinone oxidoreductase subunit A [Schaalia sp. lx-260]MCD4557301.1 NADH-quinone oxidoreductase subunit A [Schaalia sp. lx-100]
MNPYVPLLIMAAAALVLAFGGLAASAIFGPTKKSRTKADNYECGIDPSSHTADLGRFPVRYYLVAMTFIIFDIEVVFMYPWAVSFNQLGLFGLIAMLTFIALITVPYIYEWRRGGLDY